MRFWVRYYVRFRSSEIWRRVDFYRYIDITSKIWQQSGMIIFCNVILSVLQHYRHFAGECSVYTLFGPSRPVVKNAQLGTLLGRDVSGHVFCCWFSPTRKQIRRKYRMVLNNTACEYCGCGLFHGTDIKFMEPSSVGTRKRKLCL
jgi:hypothetical protein